MDASSNRMAGSPAAAAAIWSRRADIRHIDPEPSTGRLRATGLAQALAIAVAAFGLHTIGYRSAATVAWTISSVVLAAALVSPAGIYLGLRRLAVKLGEWTGMALAWLLLAPVFFLFFAPFGWLRRRGRNDRLRRQLEPDAASYWEPHSGRTAASTSRQRPY